MAVPKPREKVLLHVLATADKKSGAGFNIALSRQRESYVDNEDSVVFRSTITEMHITELEALDVLKALMDLSSDMEIAVEQLCQHFFNLGRLQDERCKRMNVRAQL